MPKKIDIVEIRKVSQEKKFVSLAESHPELVKEWDYEKGFLMDTCLTAQDRFKAYLDYFRINY